MSSIRLAAALACACAALAALPACEQKVPEPEPELGRITPPQSEPEPPDLIKEDVKVGDGAEAKDGDTVRVHYTGRLAKNGVQFDSSVGKDPFKFTIGGGQVIKGWDQGVVGMKVGGKRKLTIPSKLGYGDHGSPPKIPGKATLVFDIELLGIGDAPAPASSATAGSPKDKPAKKEPPKEKK
ncbi:MAG: FKBP-type peptidyl-prolyl cis-trans isomerase [Polyangiaceae bacterium]|nr:FKBP-type peptidyl-prolyl cis-trans isomerase [Polyangiaceae bacterium]